MCVKKMDCLTVGKQTFLELISEIQDILKSGRYDTPELISTELEAAKIVINAADESFIGDMFTTLSLFLLPLEEQIDSKNVDFFKRLEICKACEPDHRGKHDCVCKLKCEKKCKCSPTCINCSDTLKELDSKTFNAIKYIVDQAVDGGDDEQEDIDVIFDFMGTIKQIVKKYKGR